MVHVVFVEASFKEYTTLVQFTTATCRALLPYHTVSLLLVFYISIIHVHVLLQSLIDYYHT